MSTDSPLFRDAYDHAYVQGLATRLTTLASNESLVGLTPPPPGWADALALRLPPLAMKARVETVADAIEAWVGPRPPASWCELALALVETDAPLEGFAAWPPILLVERHGPQAPDAALDALESLTARFTGEFALRPLLLTAPALVWPRLHAWTRHPNHHVRRLVSEGTRTRLPWGIRLHNLILDPSPVWPLLDALRDDPSDYVRRSVANHLNDLSRDHPQAVLACLERWLHTGSPADADVHPQRQALARHALRTLIKRGDPQALALLGYGNARLSVERFDVAPATLAIGDSTRWSATLRAPHDAGGRAVVDLAVDFVRAAGRTSRKVFKGAVVDVAAGETLTLTRTLSFRPVSTRTLYPGDHRLTLQVDGQPCAGALVRLH